MVSHAFALADEFSKLPRWLKEDQEKGIEIETHKWFSRRIVRAGLEITLDRNLRYSRDLYLCFEKFSEHYPSYKEIMFEVLVNSLNGNVDPLLYEDLVTFLDKESRHFI